MDPTACNDWQRNDDRLWVNPLTIPRHPHGNRYPGENPGFKVPTGRNDAYVAATVQSRCCLYDFEFYDKDIIQMTGGRNG